ncbi:hypothetical protein [Ruminococcus sp.]|uniref:DUF6935 domain-containing protein n=1 Tax=Ruminococcus sp. TaxID=41978 RepID=UPI0025E8C590|nr:hypothetical protein [Ruminococcus sp.]MBQ8964973.1 hypothetical protein [Ruminococcus sp.]
MGLFDNIGTPPAPAPKPSGNKSVDVTFAKLPDNFAEFTALPQAKLANPFDTAALTVLALCFYPQDKEASLKMLNFLKGPQPLSAYEQQFLRDRFMDSDYVPRSYFTGACPENDYKPSQPYTVRVSENPYSYQEQGYAKLYLSSGGADSPRAVTLRLAKDGKWYLWEQFLLAGIRQPSSSSPWA